MTKEQVLTALEVAAKRLRVPGTENIPAGPRTADELDQARAAIASWPAPATWQPIETAPTEVQIVLAYFGADKAMLGFVSAGRLFRWENMPERLPTNWPSRTQPTHWMSLPEPPQ